MDAPDIRYVRSGGAAIAYCVVGEGDVDLVYLPAWLSNLVYDWQWPHWREFYERLARSFRLVLFDKRATGLSDGGGHYPALETRMEDVGAVLDAASSRRAVVFGSLESAGMAVLYAATYPERMLALVLFHPETRATEAELESAPAVLQRLRERWGTQEHSDEILRDIAPTLAVDPQHRIWFGNRLRVGASPRVAYELNRAYHETDLTDVLPAVRVPTLVLYRSVLEEPSLDVARRIPTATAVRVPGDDLAFEFLTPEIVDEVERFVAGEHPPPVPDTVLATVLFTDIVRSTERAAELGDRAWRDMLAAHNAVARRELARYRGQERDTAGDGFFATFDGSARAIRCAQAIVEGVRDLGLEVRAGIHVGECEVHERKVAGIAVAIGARVAARAEPGEVLVSSTVKDLAAGVELTFDDRGEHELKGVPGTWRLYAVTDG